MGGKPLAMPLGRCRCGWRCCRCRWGCSWRGCRGRWLWRCRWCYVGVPLLTTQVKIARFPCQAGVYSFQEGSYSQFRSFRNKEPDRQAGIHQVVASTLKTIQIENREKFRKTPSYFLCKFCDTSGRITTIFFEYVEFSFEAFFDFVD